MADKEKEKQNKKTVEEELETLREQIKTAEAEKQKIFEQLQRVSADYANYQKRSARQVAESVDYEKMKILRSLLPSLDNFEHALAGAASAKGEEAFEKILEGIKLVFNHMLEALKVHGVEKIEAAGKPFNPDFHQAMMQKCEKNKENNIVLEEFQSGYLYNGQVLRPAKVIVNKHPEPEKPENQDTDQESQDENQE